MEYKNKNLNSTLNVNNAQPSAEPLQAPLQPQAVQDGSLNQKSLGSPGNGLRTQNTAGDRPENAPTTQNNGLMAPENNKKHTGLVVVIVVILLALMSAGAGIWWVIAQNREQVAQNPTPEAPTNSSETEEQPEELDINDELVQKLYNNFDGITELFTGWWGIYADDDIKNGVISREHMLSLAGKHFRNSTCVGTYEYGNGGTVTSECASGKDVRQKIAEMFGKELELTDGDKLDEFCGGMVYDVANDEFHRIGNGCGGASSSRLKRVLTNAEKHNDKIYLTEKVLLFDGVDYYKIGTSEDLFGEKIGEYAVPDSAYESDKYNEWLAENERSLTLEYGQDYKWTFAKTPEGNYIFESLEKTEN